MPEILPLSDPAVVEKADAADGTSTAYAIAVGTAVRGTTNSLTDHDWWSVSLSAGQTYVISLVGTGADDLEDPYLHIRDAAGTVLAENDDALPNSNSQVTFTPASSGTYYIDVSSYVDTLDAGQYDLSIVAGNKGSFDLAQIVGVIESYFWWNSTRGTPAAVTFGFRATDNGREVGFSRMDSYQQTAVLQILDMYSQIANITFTQVNPGGYTDDAAILLENYNDPDGSGGYAFYPGSRPGDQSGSAGGGDVYMNTLPPGAPLSNTSYDYSALMHELGHALGLSHPGDYTASQSGPLSYSASAQFVQDTLQYTNMSYWSESSTGANFGLGIRAQTPMLADIAALQAIYGANTSTRAGNTVYGFHATAGAAVYDFASNPNPALCIWDGGGINTLDCSLYSGNQTMDLRAGHFSSVLGLSDNVSIALGTVIQVGIGGSGADRIVGNDFNDTIWGGAGNDTLTGGAGHDVARYSVNRSAATITRDAVSHALIVSAGSDGQDTVQKVEQLRFNDGFYSFEFAAGSQVYANFGQAQGWSDQTVFARHLADVNGNGAVDIVGFGGAGVFVALGWGANRPVGTSDLFLPTTLALADFGASQGWNNDAVFVRSLADVNGDGRSDIVGFGVGGTLVATAQAEGSFSTARLVLADFGTAQGWSSAAVDPRQLVDINSDHRADIVAFGAAGVYTALAAADGSFVRAGGLGDFGTNAGWTSADAYSRQVADVTGDGLADIVGFGAAGVLVARGLGNGSFATPLLAVGDFGAQQGWTSQSTTPRLLADINNDGRADIVGFGTNGVLVALARDDGTFAAAAQVVAGFGTGSGWSSLEFTPRTVVDLDHDGFLDIVGMGPGGIAVAYGLGNGTFTDASADLADFGRAQGWTSDTAYHRELADITGDGRPEIVGFGIAGMLYAANQADFLL